MSKIASIGIEGWGDPVEGLPYRIRRSHLGDAGSSVSPVALLADHPSGLSEAAQYHAGWSTRGSLSFEVMHLDASPGDTLRRYLWQANPESVGRINADITAAALSLTCYLLRGNTWPATPFNLYLEREVMTVTGVAGPVGGIYTLTVTREVFGSTASAHAAGVGKDAEIYTVNPIVEGRRVTQYDYDTSADTEAPVFQGLMVQPGGMSEDMIACEIEAESALGFFSAEREFGKGRLEGVGTIYRDALGSVVVRADTPSTRQGQLMARVSGRQALVVTDGEAIVAASLQWLNTLGTSGYSAVLRNEPSASNELYGTTAKAKESAEGSPLWECLIADAESPYSLVRNAAGALSDHPLDLWLCILTSTGTATWPSGGAHTVGTNGAYDWLPAHFGFGCPADLIDITAIEALRDDDLYLNGLRCQNFVLAEYMTAPALAGRILLPLGLWPTTSATGLITLAQIQDFADADADATLTDSDLAQRMTSQPWAEMERFGKIRIDMGRKGLSSSYGDQVTDTDFADYLSNRFPYGVPKLVIDGGDYGLPDVHSVPEAVREQLIHINKVRWLLAVQRLPVYLITIYADSAGRLPPGSRVLLTNRVAVNDQGDRGVTTRRCVVLQQSVDAETGAQSLTLIDLYPVTRASRVVSPCWRIASVTDATDQVLVEGEFTANDWGTWIEEGRVVLCDRTGLAKSKPRVADAIGAAGAITMSTPWDVVPVAGDLIRIADHDDLDSYLYWTIQAWIADDNATLGAAAASPARWSF